VIGTAADLPLPVRDHPQTRSRRVIEHAYREFLLQNHDPDERKYPDAADQVREVLIHENYLVTEGHRNLLGLRSCGRGQRAGD